LTDDIVSLATQYCRYGYRRITVLLRDAGWAVNFKRVERIWRREGFKVPMRRPIRASATRPILCQFLRSRRIFSMSGIRSS
jgi:hypothetical protein